MIKYIYIIIWMCYLYITRPFRLYHIAFEIILNREQIEHWFCMQPSRWRFNVKPLTSYDATILSDVLVLIIRLIIKKKIFFWKCSWKQNLSSCLNSRSLVKNKEKDKTLVLNINKTKQTNIKNNIGNILAHCHENKYMY